MGREQEKKLRKLKKDRDSFSNDIINFMIQGSNRNTDIKIGQSKITCQENKTMSSLNQGFIKSSIHNFFIEKYPNILRQKKDIPDEIFNYILNSRKQTKKIILKRIFN